MTVSLVKSLCGLAPDSYVPAINEALTRFDITTPRRIRYFIAQSLFETSYYRAWEEVLTYTTAARLVAVFPSRFSLDGSDGKAKAADYLNNPIKLGNLIYASRNGNGNEASGDGFNFRGRGAFHLTGRGNYLDYSTHIYGDDRIVQTPALVAAPTDAFMSAGYFWSTRNLNQLADADQFTLVTKAINGSTVTVPDRLPVLNRVNGLAGLLA